MKKLKNTLFLCFGIMILLFSLSSCDSERAESVLHEPEDTQAISYGDVLYEIDIKSPQGFVYDVKGDCFIFEKGRSLVVYPGSTSKLLTVLYALSVLEPEMVVTAGDELDFVKEGSSVAYIKKGHQLTVEMLPQAQFLGLVQSK